MGKFETLDPLQLLMVARQDGNLGPLLDYYRGYLKVIARLQIGTGLQGKVDASDVVQEVLVQIHRSFPAFKGATEKELLAWLRQILANTVAKIVRRYVHTQARDINLERQLQQDVEDTSQAIGRVLISTQPSPSEHLMQREQAVILASLLEELPDDYRQVVLMRHMQHLTFPEIATQMDRSTDSVKKVWARAVVKLRQLLAEQQ